MSKHDADNKPVVAKPEDKQCAGEVSAGTALTDLELTAAYRSVKAEHKLPSSVKQRIMRQAKQRLSQQSWRSWWYFSQFALGCAALVLVLSWVNPAQLPTYYQIETIISPGSGNTAQNRVQWHHLTASAAERSPAAASFSNDSAGIVAAEKSIVQQRLTTLKQQQRSFQRAGEHSTVMQRQVGLLTQHEDVWQIAMCDDLQLNVAIDLVHELRALMQVAPAIQPQWVELQFAPSGHILAIASLPATKTANQCPSPQLPVVQS